MADKIEYALLAANVYGVSTAACSSRNSLPIPTAWSGATSALVEYLVSPVSRTFQKAWRER